MLTLDLKPSPPRKLHRTSRHILRVSAHTYISSISACKDTFAMVLDHEVSLGEVVFLSLTSCSLLLGVCKDGLLT